MNKKERLYIGLQVILVVVLIVITSWATANYIIKTMEINTVDSGYEVTILDNVYLYE